MSRNFSNKSIVLTHRRMGEKNLLVKLFTQEFGIIDAIGYGAQGMGSKLRPIRTIGTIGTAYLSTYRNRPLHKLSEFEPDINQNAIVNNPLYFLYASLWTEIVIATFASGTEYSQSFVLLCSALAALRTCATEPPYLLATARFLWRYLRINGISPDITHCGRCGRALELAPSSTIVVASSRIYCPACHLDRAASSPYPELARHYPAALRPFFARSDIPFAQIAIDARYLAMRKPIFDFAIVMVEHTIGRPLKSLPVIRAL